MRHPVFPEAVSYEYTLMPTHMRGRFRADEMKDAVLSEPLPFTKGMPVLKIPGHSSFAGGAYAPGEHRLYDLKADPGQTREIHDPNIERRMIQKLLRLIREQDAPPELYARYGLEVSEETDHIVPQGGSAE